MMSIVMRVYAEVNAVARVQCITWMNYFFIVHAINLIFIDVDIEIYLLQTCFRFVDVEL